MKSLYLAAIFLFTGYISFGQCDPTLNKYIYHPDRLVVIKECTTVTGIVTAVISDPDGDYHIRLKLDAGQEDLLNGKNKTAQHGCLVVEIICAHKVTQKDAMKSCASCKNKIKKPNKGDHITVTGRLVTDNVHGWNEIHPASSISLIIR